MFNWIIRKIIGTKNQRTVRRLTPTVTEINRIEAQLQNEPEEALRERTQKWQAQFRAFQQLRTDLQSARSQLEDRAVLDKAKVLLMRHKRIGEPEAHQLLIRLAMDNNQRLRDVAQTVIVTLSALETRT